MSHDLDAKRPARGILEDLHRQRRRTVHLELDRPWLQKRTSQPDAVLRDMSRSGLLQKIGEGKYVLATPGTGSALENAPISLLTDLTLRHVSQYYIGFLTALISHHLTDLHSSRTYVAVPQGTRLRGQISLDLQLVQLSDRYWPNDDELERYRVIAGTKEFAVRSSIERTLVDALNRPELCAGFETVATAWARARDRDAVSWTKVAEIGRRCGSSSARRTAFMLGELGLEDVVDREFTGLVGRGANTPLDRSQGFTSASAYRDARTGVAVNVPKDYLSGWLSEEIG